MKNLVARLHSQKETGSCTRKTLFPRNVDLSLQNLVFSKLVVVLKNLTMISEKCTVVAGQRKFCYAIKK